MPVPTAQKSRDAVAIAGRLRIGVTRLNRLLRRQADTGLTPSQLSALATVEHHGAMTLGALAEHERFAPPSITTLANKLEGLGLLHREASPADGRVHLVSLTDDGRALLAESRQRKNEWLAERLGRLTPDEQARLADALDVIDALLTQEQP